ncbi:MAG: 1-acyl-sn-glycerol-3-phosphate acyltransferase, partial [Eubacteriales bacterium]|nr:1-acyl-sn-glycerol-3-phosphate acyltransferase [Eubacteriales bacterium]
MSDLTKKKKNNNFDSPASYRSNFRYRFTFSFLKIFIRPIMWLLFNYKALRYDVPKDENYIILSNHTGAMDPVMLAFSFNRPIFFVASDHISR